MICFDASIDVLFILRNCMDKLILGLDIGVSSVGFALLREKENGDTSIERIGVRIVTEDPNFHGKFYTGNTASKNADRR